MAIGILGGTFDPVHNAHLAIARRALDVLSLATLRWIPTGSPVHRPAAMATTDDRLAMLELGIQGEPRFAIDRSELGTEASGYTFDTLQSLRRDLGATLPIVFLLGADQAAKLDQWHRWREVLRLVHLGVFARAGAGAPLPAEVHEEFAHRQAECSGPWRNHPGGAVIRIDWTPLAISASEIRRRIAQGESAAEWLPAAVLDYIVLNRLYQEQA